MHIDIVETEMTMGLFYTDSLVLSCTDLIQEKQWWFQAFECREIDRPAEWDCPLPSDVALKLPGAATATILLCDRNEVTQAGYERQNDHPILFCRNLKKAHQQLQGRPGPIRTNSGPSYFEVTDPDGNSIEICAEG